MRRGESRLRLPRSRQARGRGRPGTLGFRARRSHDVVDSAIPACPLFGPELARALPALRALARGLAPGVELDVQAGAEGVHLNVAAGRRRPARRTPAARSIAWTRPASSACRSRASRRSGAPEVDVAEPGSPPLGVPAGGFAQVGRAANAALVAAVLEAVGPAPGVVLELYAGSGNFTRHLAARAARRRSFASDGDPAAVERGRRNVPGAAWSRAPAGRFARHGRARSAARGRRPRPPRPSPSARAAASSTSRAIRRRWGATRATSKADGFRLAQAVALDLMPQTFHVEVVATFEPGEVVG